MDVVLNNGNVVMISKIVRIIRMNKIVHGNKYHYKFIQNDKQYDKDKKLYFVVVMKVNPDWKLNGVVKIIQHYHLKLLIIVVVFYYSMYKLIIQVFMFVQHKLVPVYLL